MFLYLDTSAWVKLYIEEDGSGVVRRAFRDADAWATAPMALAEIHAGLQNRVRRKYLDRALMNNALARVSDHWPSFYKVEAKLALPNIPQVCADHALRGADAWHFANAKGLRAVVGDLYFVCADKKLVQAARKERFQVITHLDL